MTTTMTAARIADLHAPLARKGGGYAPSLADCLDAAREGRLVVIDTASDGEDGMDIDAPHGAHSPDDVILRSWAERARPEDVEASGMTGDDWARRRRWTVTRVTLAD